MSKYANGASLSAIGRSIYVVAIRKGNKTMFKYGSKLKDLRAHVKDGQEFIFARYDKGKEWNAAYVGGVLATKAR